ncbi:MAG: hypothetical protein WAM13_06370 [Candidatus Sulfotelmatobacter sp.]
MKKRFKNEVHPEILRQTKGRFAQGFGFSPRGLGQGKIGCHLFFCFLLGSNLKDSADQAANLPFRIAHRETARPHPAHLAAWPDDPKSFIKLPVLGRFVELPKYVDTIVRVDDVFIRRWILHQRPARAPSDGLISLVDIKGFLTAGIDHPEDFLDIAGHLLEFMFCRLEDTGSVALVTAQLEQHLGQKKTENAKSGSHAAQQHY